MGEYINSQVARFDRSTVSCGVVEVHHIPERVNQVVFALATHLYHKANPRPAAIAIFSDVRGGRGEQLAAEIERLGIVGTIRKTEPTVNPRTGNVIILWTIVLNHESFRAWYQEELANRITE